MNILQAYIKKHKQIVILILGLPCSNKSEIAKELGEDLELPLVNINDYLKSDEFIEKEFNGIKFKLYEHPDNYNWDKLNQDVKNNLEKVNGIIVYGNYIESSRIDFSYDFCYFFNMNTTLCKTILIEKQMLPYKDDNEIYSTIKSNIKINKFYNIKEKTTFDETYDDVFNNLMEHIEKKI